MSNRIYLAAAIGCLSLQAAMPAAADDSKCCLRLTPYYWAVDRRQHRGQPGFDH